MSGAQGSPSSAEVRTTEPEGGRSPVDGLSLREAEATLRRLAGPQAVPGGELAPPVVPPLTAYPFHGAHPADSSAGGEEKYRRAEARYRTLVEQLPAVTFMAALDQGDNELYVSPQIEALLGFSQKEWLEDPILWYRQLHPDDRQRWHSEFAQTCAAAKHFRAEYRFLARNGSVVWVHGEAKVVRDEQGNPLYLQGIAFDITARKQAEESLRQAHDQLEQRVAERTAELARANEVLQQEVRERKWVEGELRRVNADLAWAHERAVEASRVKSVFLANMSHELRTPLNAIIGYSELLQELAAKKIPRDPAADLEKITRAGKHLMAIINDILDLSKIEAGKMELVPEPFGVDELIRDMATTVAPLLAKNANALELGEELGLGMMDTDITRMRQCLLNLLSNACKFTQNGTIRLEVAREPGPAADWMVFRVSDTGIGMTPEQLGRLFQAFSQADASTTRKYGGTGLGLAITKKICEIMGGDISVASTPGKGSTFTMRVPGSLMPSGAEKDSGTSRQGTPFEAIPEASRSDLPTVLVIDDDPLIHDLTSRLLTDEGFSVVHAANGRDGMRLARQLRPAAITLDVMMPGMDGWSTLSLLKADPELASIPVILLTIVDERGSGIALGASDYLTKPIDKGRLVSLLSKFTSADVPRSILLVEDDLGSRTLLSRVLQHEGWAVREAADGGAALQAVAEEAPGLILLDLMMPEVDGFEFVRRLREVEAWRAIPVVVVTAKPITEEDLRRLEGQTEQVLQKSATDATELLKQVSNLLKSVPRASAAGPASAPVASA